MRALALPNNHLTLLDDVDFDSLSKFKWHAYCDHSGKWYVRSNRRSGKRTHVILMHRAILDAPKGMEVDHIDGNGLNNQRDNLRLATSSQNKFNRRLDQRNKSGHKGVVRRGQKWAVYIGLNNKQIYLGRFAKIEDAIRVRLEATAHLHGEFGRLR